MLLLCLLYLVYWIVSASRLSLIINQRKQNEKGKLSVFIIKKYFYFPLNGTHFAHIPILHSFLSVTWHLYVIEGSIMYSSDNLFYTSLTRYYNCVPFGGCVFVGPSKMCHPRVKTFDEFPLEMHPQKAPQVSFLFLISYWKCEPAGDILQMPLDFWNFLLR